MDAREALLKATIKIFSASGTRGATTRRIAQEAGVNEVTLFRQFQSKADLIHAALQYFAARSVFSELPTVPVDPELELSAWCREHHRRVYRVRALLRKAMGEYEEHPERCAQGLQGSARVADELTAYLKRLKAHGIATGPWDEHAAAAMLMGTLFSDAMGRDTMPDRYPYPMGVSVLKYVQLFLNAIGAPALRDAHPVEAGS